MSNILSESEEKILRTLRQDLNLVGFANSLEQQFVNPKIFMELTFIERLEQCIENQCLFNKNKRLATLLHAAKLPKEYTMRSLDPSRYRDIKREMWAYLSSGNWIFKADNIIIRGKSGSGKTSLASALGYLSCSLGYKTLWIRTNELITKIKSINDEVQRTKIIERYDKVHCLILDDFLIHDVATSEEIRILYRLMDGRDAKLPTIFVTQLNSTGISTMLGNDFSADGLKDRILGPAYFIELNNEEGRTPSTKI